MALTCCWGGRNLEGEDSDPRKSVLSRSGPPLGAALVKNAPIAGGGQRARRYPAHNVTTGGPIETAML
ncbi:hypothetical protein C2E23DRAFT_836304, partial [Lenzites betulinus]